MKILYGIIFFGIFFLGCISCKNQTEKKVVVQSVTEIESDSLLHVRGVVIDATMNGFTIITSKNDTLHISTMDRNIALDGGLTLGDTLDVSYLVTEEEPTINVASALKKVH